MPLGRAFDFFLQQVELLFGDGILFRASFINPSLYGERNIFLCSFLWRTDLMGEPKFSTQVGVDSLLLLRRGLEPVFRVVEQSLTFLGLLDSTFIASA